MKSIGLPSVAALLILLFSPAVAYGQAQPVQPSTIPLPGKAPPVDPYAPRTQVRAPSVAANDNMLRGLGKSAGALGDDLRLVVSAEEAAARQARYVRGVSAALAGGGLAASNPYLARLARIGKRFKPLGALLTILSLGGVAYELYKSGDADTQHYYTHSPATTDVVEPSYSGQKVWSDRFIDGAKYPTTMPALSSHMPGQTVPVGRVFITAMPPTSMAAGVIFAMYVEVPSSTPNSDTVKTLADGKKYRLHQHVIRPSFSGGALGPKWEVIPDDTEWVIYRGTNNPSYDPNKTLVPVLATSAAGNSAPIPPEIENAPVATEIIRYVIEAGLEAAGLSATEAQKEQLAQTAAAEMTGKDLNVVPDVNIFINPAATPLGSYIPEAAHEAASEPSTPSQPGTNPETPGSGTPAKVDQTLEIEDPGDMPALPVIDVGDFTYNPGNCPNPSMDFNFSDPNVNGIRAQIGLPEEVTFDICSHMEDWAPFFQPLFLLLWTVLAFRIARGS